MLIPLALILFGLDKAGAETPADPAGPVPGLYVERQADGRADCDNAQANRLSLHLAPGGVPPHARSANVGEAELTIGGRSDSAVLTASGDRWRFGGGRQQTVGREIEGVTSAFLIGHFTLELAPVESGDLRLIQASSSRVRRPDPDPDSLYVLVRDGAIPEGRPLRAFSRCDEVRRRR